MIKSELWKKRKEFLFEYQKGRCTVDCDRIGCPLPENRRLKYSDDYISIDHKFQKKRAEKSAELQQKRFGNMIDSVLNLRLVPNVCNVERMGQDRMTEEEALKWEDILNRGLQLGGYSYSDILNMKTDLPYDEVLAVLEEVQLSYEEENK